MHNHLAALKMVPSDPGNWAEHGLSRRTDAPEASVTDQGRSNLSGSAPERERGRATRPDRPEFEHLSFVPVIDFMLLAISGAAFALLTAYSLLILL